MAAMPSPVRKFRTREFAEACAERHKGFVDENVADQKGNYFRVAKFWGEEVKYLLENGEFA